MRRLNVVLTVMMTAWTVSCELNTDFSPFSNEFVDHINSLNTTWEAKVNFQLDNKLETIRMLFGALKSDEDHSPPPMMVKSLAAVRIARLPSSFDAREKWPNCTSIGKISDQGSCGACWAMAAADAMSDRICIHLGAEKRVQISSHDLLSCCTTCGTGCDGGYLGEGWNHWVKNGVVTGGDYGSRKGCMPYLLEPCSHFINGTKPPCTKTTETPSCYQECNEEYLTPYNEDIRRGAIAYSLDNNERDIMKEIYTRGPVTTVFEAYTDFLQYESGVYQHVAGESAGWHAVRIIGWGEEEDTPYWLVANSWNSEWGDKGYIKFLRGQNHCKIENGVVAGLPK